MNDQDLHAYCEAWRHWCWTRKYYIAPGAKNILARMQPSKTVDRDYPLSADLSYFNMAVHALADMGGDAEPFILFYYHRIKNIKAEAARMECSRQTFYRRVNRFARDAYTMSISLKRVTENMPAGVEATD